MPIPNKKSNHRPVYRPKTKYKANHTGFEEFVYKKHSNNFVKPGVQYFEYANGSYWEGENINKPTVQIHKFKGDKKDNTYIIKTEEIVYNKRRSDITEFQDNLEPVYATKTFPIEKDYEKGWMYRYVAFRLNSTSEYKEINKEIYDDIIKKSGT